MALPGLAKAQSSQKLSHLSKCRPLPSRGDYDGYFLLLMESKDLIGLVLAIMGIAGGVLVTCISARARDVFFFGMVWLAPMTEDYDINFVSRNFYRGTTRGFEFSLVDILSISLLLSALLIPRRGNSRGYWPASL